MTAPVATSEDRILRWSGRVVSAAELRLRLKGHRRLLVPTGAVVTPLAREELREREVEIEWLESVPVSTSGLRWFVAQQWVSTLVRAAVASLARDGQAPMELPPCVKQSTVAWGLDLARRVGLGEFAGGIVFCEDPALLCCVANKLPGLRAAGIATVSQAARATLTLGPNFAAVEMPGRTLFEIRQILRTFLESRPSADVTQVTATLKELESRAHR